MTIPPRPCRQVFSSESALRGIVERVVSPNLALREADEELFSDNPADYVRADHEGSDAHSRRRAACELVKEAAKAFPREVTALSQEVVAALMKQDAASAGAQWKAKDAAVRAGAAAAWAWGGARRGGAARCARVCRGSHSSCGGQALAARSSARSVGTPLCGFSPPPPSLPPPPRR